jgi:hypothetical protein
MRDAFAGQRCRVLRVDVRESYESDHWQRFPIRPSDESRSSPEADN